jgi:hypothetical protein
MAAVYTCGSRPQASIGAWTTATEASARHWPAASIQPYRWPKPKHREDAREQLAQSIDPSAVKRSSKITDAGKNTVQAIGRAWLALKKDGGGGGGIHYGRECRNLEKDLLPQSALHSKTPIQAMGNWYDRKLGLFNKKPVALTAGKSAPNCPGCDS